MRVFNPKSLARATLFLLVPLAVTQAFAHDAVETAQIYPREACFSRKETMQAVQAGRAKPLREMRSLAERTVGGEMVDADLCNQNGVLTYVITVLTGSGKVGYVTLDAAKGNLLGVR
jgi:uncharacterized membrane protein YkoI